MTSLSKSFVSTYVAKLDAQPLDPHVWPQIWHLCDVRYDCVFYLSDLFLGMQQIIGNELAKKFFEKKTNSSPHFDVPVSAEILDALRFYYRDDYALMDRVARSPDALLR